MTVSRVTAPREPKMPDGNLPAKTNMESAGQIRGSWTFGVQRTKQRAGAYSFDLVSQRETVISATLEKSKYLTHTFREPASGHLLGWMSANRKADTFVLYEVVTSASGEQRAFATLAMHWRLNPDKSRRLDAVSVPLWHYAELAAMRMHGACSSALSSPLMSPYSAFSASAAGSPKDDPTMRRDCSSSNLLQRRQRSPMRVDIPEVTTFFIDYNSSRTVPVPVWQSMQAVQQPVVQLSASPRLDSSVGSYSSGDEHAECVTPRHLITTRRPAKLAASPFLLRMSPGMSPGSPRSPRYGRSDCSDTAEGPATSPCSTRSRFSSICSSETSPQTVLGTRSIPTAPHRLRSPCRPGHTTAVFDSIAEHGKSHGGQMAILSSSGIERSGIAGMADCHGGMQILRHLHGLGGSSAGLLQLPRGIVAMRSAQPHWDQVSNSHVVSFGGLVHMSSVKNMVLLALEPEGLELACPGGDGTTAACERGRRIFITGRQDPLKTGSEFVCSHDPLTVSPLQAFALSIASVSKKPVFSMI